MRLIDRAGWSPADQAPSEKQRSRGRRIFLVATPGGHLDLLVAIRGAFTDFERVWVVSRSNTADELIADGEQVHLVPRFHGYSPRNFGHALQSLQPLIQGRPSLVITSGSGSVVPFCLGARAMGAKLIFLETMARVTNASAAGRTLSKFASRVLVQWPEMASVYKGTRVCRPALLDDLPELTCSVTEGRGTFVAVGTHVDPFDRLLLTVDDAIERGVLPIPVVAQSGVSQYKPRNFAVTPWLTPTEIDAAILEHRYMVCHAGSGLIARALGAHRKPIIIPRLAALGEHVDDHQLQIATRLGEYGLVVPVQGEVTPRDVAAAHYTDPVKADFDAFPRMEDALREELEAAFPTAAAAVATIG